MPRKKSKKSLRTKTWNLLSRYTRLKYADSDGFVYCITCDRRLHWKDAHAGHFIPQGRGNRARFCYAQDIEYGDKLYVDVWNMAPQCPQCNIGKYGAVHLYTGKMVDKYGSGIAEALEAYCRVPWQMKEADYEEIIADLKDKLADLGD